MISRVFTAGAALSPVSRLTVSALANDVTRPWAPESFRM